MRSAMSSCRQILQRRELSEFHAIAPRLVRCSNRPQLIWSRTTPSSVRNYATSKSPTEPPPFESSSRDSDTYRRKGWFSSLFGRSKPDKDDAWEPRRVGDEVEGYEPDAEWESLQVLSNLIRKLKTEPPEGEDELREIEYELKDAIDDLIPRLARDELPVVHVRLISEAWNILYTPKIGSVPESDDTAIVKSADAARIHFNAQELKKLLHLIAGYPDKSEYHVELGRKVYHRLMRLMEKEDSSAQEQFLLFILLLSRNQANTEMVLAFNELLRVLDTVDERMAVTLISIINNIADEKVQEIIVARLFQTAFFDIGAFNIILQSAIEHDQRNIWNVYGRVFSPTDSAKPPLEPNLDTLELLFRYVVQDSDAEESQKFMTGVKSVLFDEAGDPLFDLAENQSLYRSYLTACIVSNEAAVGSKLYDLFSDPALTPELEVETWQVLAQWVTFSEGTIASLSAQLAKMNSFGFETDTAVLNGIMRASQVGQTSEEFRSAVFDLYEQYNIPLDTTSVGLRIRDRVRSGKPLEAVNVFRRGVGEGLTWNYKVDDMKALFIMLQGLTSLEPFDAGLLVEMYTAVRLYVKSVDDQTRLAMVKAFLGAGEIGNLSSLLHEELGDSYKYHPDTFPDLYEALHAGVLDRYDREAARMIYACIHKHFIPPYESYLPIMKHFTDIGYGELALDLFRHVRKGTDTPPQRDMYALIFRQFARIGFVKGIEEVILCYRLDLNVDPDIGLFNAILEACDAANMPYYSYTLWQQIRLAAAAKNLDGLDRQPNTETFRLLMKIASETGAGLANALWKEFANYPVKLTPEHYMDYFVGLFEGGYPAKALSVALGALELPEPDALPGSSERGTSAAEFVSIVYNYMQTDEQRQVVREWAEKAHPEAWANRVELPTDEQRRRIAMNRVLANDMDRKADEKLQRGLAREAERFGAALPAKDE